MNKTVAKFRNVVNPSAKKQALLLAAFIFLSTVLCTMVAAYIGSKSLKEEIQQDILGIAHTASLLTDGDIHQTLMLPEQKNSNDYLKVQEPYRLLLVAHPQLRYVYTAVLRDGKVYFIIDTQPEGSDGRPEKERKTTANIMEEYPDATPKFRQALEQRIPRVEDEVYQDEWGRFLSAYAPIYNSKKEFLGVVGVDIDAAYLQSTLQKIWITGAVGTVLAVFFSVSAYLYIIKSQGNDERARLMRLAKEDAERSNRLKSEFLANITHELKTPVHCIMNFAQIGTADCGKGKSGNLKEHFEDILANGKRLDVLISDLLDLSKVELGSMDFHFDMYPVRGMVESAVAATRGLADKKQLRIDMSDVNECACVIVDAGRMEQVLVNLMSNAIRFSPEGGCITWRSYSTTMPVCASNIFAPALAVSIEDEGPGVPEYELDSIFEHFVQGREARSKGGTGLGLAICRRFLQNFHGTIQAGNTAKGGARFTITLPLWHTMDSLTSNTRKSHHA